jgi:hypothetical protein
MEMDPAHLHAEDPVDPEVRITIRIKRTLKREKANLGNLPS